MSRCRHYSHLTQENVEKFFIPLHKVAAAARTTFFFLRTFPFAALQPGHFMINEYSMRNKERADATATATAALIKIQSTELCLRKKTGLLFSSFLLNKKWHYMMVVFMYLSNHSLDKSRAHIIFRPKCK